MRACKDIDFLDSYWAEAKRIAKDVNENLAVGCGDNRRKPYSDSGVKMYIVKFSDLGSSWSPQDIIRDVAGKSNTLQALADKICRMIEKGRADSVKPMVQAICNNSIKKLTKHPSNYKIERAKRDDSLGILKRDAKGDFLGYGHFRWNYQAYKLDKVEIRHLKEYFKL